MQSGLALSAACAAGQAIFPSTAGAAQSQLLRLDLFVFDRRFAEAVDVARHVAGKGVPTTQVAGDMMGLWYDHLDLQWKRQPAAVAGMTTLDGLFVLETLAADHRMRVVYRGEHRTPRDGQVSHALRGPASLIRPMSRADASLWRPMLARAMTRCPLGAPSIGELDLKTRAEPASLREAPLYSWIIAPRTSVALRV